MGKWADAFKAHIRARDTADTGDTSLGGPEAFPGSVSSVMPTDDGWVGGRHHIPTLCPQCPHCHAPDGHEMQSAGCLNRARSRMLLRRSPQRTNAH